MDVGFMFVYNTPLPLISRNGLDITDMGGVLVGVGMDVRVIVVVYYGRLRCRYHYSQFM